MAAEFDLEPKQKLTYPLSFQEEMAVLKVIDKQKSERLKRYFPWKIVLGACVLVIALSIVQLAVQIALIVGQKNTNNGASGVWAGVNGIFISILRLILIRKRNYPFFRVCNAFSVVNVNIDVTVVAVNIIALALTATTDGINILFIVIIAASCVNIVVSWFYFLLMKRIMRVLNEVS